MEHLQTGKVVSVDHTVDIKEMWEADRLRTERVRALPQGYALEEALARALGDVEETWWEASTSRTLARAALASFQLRHPDRVDAFAQRLMDEVAPWATVFDWAIDFDVYDTSARQQNALGSTTVLRILTAEPAAIIRAIILALPERDT
jgi:hypothetical protein